MMELKFDLYDPIGDLPKIVSELATISNKLEYGGGFNVQRYALYHYIDAAQCFNDQKGVIYIFVYGVDKLYAMIATVTRTSEANRAKESAKKVDMGLELEASITESFSTVLPSILVGNMK